MDRILNDYIYHIQFTEPKSETTISAYKKDLEDFVAYLKEQQIEEFNTIKYEDLLSYIDFLEESYAKSTIDRKLSAIKNFFKYMLRYGLIDFNATSYLSSQKRQKTLPSVLNQKELKTLLSFSLNKPKDYLDMAILTLIFATGIRVSECVSLTFSQVFEEERWLKIVGKGDKERMVPISSDAFSNLKYYIENIRPQFEVSKTNRVFINEKGNHITRQYIHTMIQLRQKETGLKKKISAHTLRHTLATTMLNNEVDLRVIQEILGHSDIKTTQIYTHVDNQKMKSEYDELFDVNFDKKEGD